MLGIGRWLRGRRRGEDGPVVFREIMSMAQGVGASNPVALRKLVRCLLWPEVFTAIRGVVEAPAHRAPDRARALDFFNRGGDLYHGVDAQLLRLRKAVDASEREEVVDLARDVVFAGPWNKDCFIKAVSRIGSECGGREWRQDTANHHVELWLPWRIVIVHGGNHSITSGMLGGEGVLKPDDVFDYRSALKAVSCDGRRYRRVEDGAVEEVVLDARRAAVFEVGRLMG